MNNKEMFKMLTSTMWQDYKGYKRDLGLKSPKLRYFGWIVWGLFLTAIGIFLTVGCLTSRNDTGILLIFTLPFAACGLGIFIVAFVFLYRFSSVDGIAYDIELSTTDAKIFRTRKSKYGIVCDDKEPLGDGTFLRLILEPNYIMIKRTDDNCFILSRKSWFSSKTLHGMFNSEIKRITVPVSYDSINRPNASADLYVAEKDGHTTKFNSFGDRIIR